MRSVMECLSSSVRFDAQTRFNSICLIIFLRNVELNIHVFVLYFILDNRRIIHFIVCGTHLGRVKEVAWAER